MIVSTKSNNINNHDSHFKCTKKGPGTWTQPLYYKPADNFLSHPAQMTELFKRDVFGLFSCACCVVASSSCLQTDGPISKKIYTIA